MARFLVDANLPKKFKFWSGEEFWHVADFDSKWPDSKVWDFARANNLTIITKDADFSDRIIAVAPPPKVIHLKTGNMRLQNFHDFISKNWEEIKLFSQTHKLVNVYMDRITAIK
jgi:predicted nuclease of predicted toxin-antitoxin system